MTVFFEFLFGNAEKGTYYIGYIGKGEKKNNNGANTLQ